MPFLLMQRENMNLHLKRILFFIIISIPIFNEATPLIAHAWDLQIQAGVAPTWWISKREDARLSNFPVPGNPNLDFFDSPSFRKLFHLPWIIGGQVGYAWCDAVRLYVEVNYMQARGKDDVSIATVTTPSLAAILALKKYRLVEAYIGSRYYWDYWCDRLSFFWGVKIGLVHHYNSHLDFAIGVPLIPPTTFVVNDVPAFNHRTSISGGINTGADIHFCNNWSFVFTMEFVASAGPRIGSRIMLGEPIGQFTTASFGAIGAEIRFPITVAVKYTF
jgi:hypothetical protein